MTLILNREEVVSVLEMKDCMNVVELAFKELASGTAVLPLRTTITTPYGISLYMPAYLIEMNALAFKVVTVYKNNPENFKLPTTIGKVLLQDPDTGDVISIMDGEYLTAMRTGAVSGIATKYLARKDNHQTLGIFGAGIQARMQLWAVSEARNISKVLVYDLIEDAINSFINEMSDKLNIEIIGANNPDELLIADIICTATTSPSPLFDGKKVKEGTHINSVGSYTPDTRELDTEIIKRSTFVGDSREACFKEAGDFIIPVNESEITESHFYAELGDIITAKKEGRINDEEITIFKSTGLAIQDVATAKLIYEKAQIKGIGTTINI